MGNMSLYMQASVQAVSMQTQLDGVAIRMKIELLNELVNELIEYNTRSLANYQADGNKEMEMYCNGKVDAYETILDAIS